MFVVCVQPYKKDSPSSGLFRVKVYNEHGLAARTGTGMFPRAVTERFPLLSLEEEGRLNDLPLGENFIEQVFAYYRWTEMPKSADASCMTRTADIQWQSRANRYARSTCTGALPARARLAPAALGGAILVMSTRNGADL